MPGRESRDDGLLDAAPARPSRSPRRLGRQSPRHTRPIRAGIPSWARAFPGGLALAEAKPAGFPLDAYGKEAMPQPPDFLDIDLNIKRIKLYSGLVAGD
jgi:hypothetical protein